MRKFIRPYYIAKKAVKHNLEIERLFSKQEQSNHNRQIQFYNWWPHDSHSMWLHDFIQSRGIIKDHKRTIALCSVFDSKNILNHVNSDVRIFFSGENLHNVRHAQYAGYMLSGNNPFDLALGFDYFEDENYLRFPLWLTYMFKPDATFNEIKIKCKQLRYPLIGKRNKFATLIARADWNGIRTDIYNMMIKFGRVDCPSSLLHNDDDLTNIFCDNKIEYLKQYHFNICPENTNAYGYVTEKLFEAIEAGCIPVYWGSYNNPECDVLNKEAILFWENKTDNKFMITKIKEMMASESILYDFAKQSRLIDDAEDIIIEYFNKLEEKLRMIINNS